MPRSRSGRTGAPQQQRRDPRRAALAFATSLAVVGLIGVPATVGDTPHAQAAPGSVYIDEPLQGGSLAGWSVQGSGNYSNSNGSRGSAWVPLQTTVAQNNALFHSSNTNNCMNGTWPVCTATRNTTRDGKWLTLTTDNTNDGAGQAGTVLYGSAFSSDLGVVLEYDQRVYRTNDGRIGGSPANQGGGDGISVYLADANAPDYGDAAVDTTPGEAGGYGAGLGYSSVANTGDAFCPAQQGVAGGYLGLGFDVYGNYQKSEKVNTASISPAADKQWNRNTRPYSVSGGSPDGFVNLSSPVSSARIPQSIGLRGSGIRYGSAPGCTPTTVTGMNAAYGLRDTGTPLVTAPGYRTVFQVKWAASDSPSGYHGEYQPGGVGGWTAVSGQPVPANLLPAGFNDPRGYVMFTVPDSVSTFSFRYTNTNSTSSPTGTFAGIARDVSLGNAPTYTTLNRFIGGYRWLAGTPNLSAYGNPTSTSSIGANDAALRGAVIDNRATDSTQYRRIRLTINPTPDGRRTVTVFWTDKLDVSDDACLDANGAELTGKIADGTSDTCTAAGGTWQHAGAYDFHQQFSYDIASSPYQADFPSQFKLGFAASTGWAVNYHQIRNLRVTSLIDLVVDKTVQATGSSESTDPANWADSASAHGGEHIAYRIEAANDGPSDLDPDFPATLTDGLKAVPFDDPAAVSWTAIAAGGAEICSSWNAASLSCAAWVTTLSGTGALTDAAPLRWHSPSRTEASTASVVVEFHGIANPAAAPGVYPNTATVTTSSNGGPQEDDLTDNSDDAQLTLLPGWSLSKSADPASGSVVQAGQIITYAVTATALSPGAAGDIDGTTVTDDLSDVAVYADYAAGSLLIDGAAPAGVTVTEPTAANGHVLTVAGLDVPGGTTVAITYQVAVKDPSTANASFRNVVLGALPGNPPVQCASDSEPDYLVNCSTEHRTEALIQILKVGETTTGEVVPFDGSEWAIHPDAGGAPGPTPVIEFGPSPKTEAIGQGLFQAPIAPGDYWLIETKALDGFNLLPDPVAFTVSADGSVALADGDSALLTACPSGTAELCSLVPSGNVSVPTIVIKDVPQLDLPDAGGDLDPIIYPIIGVALLVIAGAVAIVILLRRRSPGTGE